MRIPPAALPSRASATGKRSDPGSWPSPFPPNLRRGRTLPRILIERDAVNTAGHYRSERACPARAGNNLGASEKSGNVANRREAAVGDRGGARVGLGPVGIQD